MGLNFSPSYAIFTALHVVIFALSLAVCGLYGQEIKHEDHASKWIYAVVVGALSAITCVAYFIPLVLQLAGIVMPVWNFILFVLWTAVFGVFGSMYINKHPKGSSTGRMKNAVWVDLVCMLLWFIAMLASAGYWWKHRDTRSQFTGRAHV